ncbi:MAG: hypothetical protein AAGD34_00440 [Pseudomonadota bacterium]
MNGAVVVALFNAIDEGDFARAKSCLSDDFTRSSTLHPDPMDGDTWLGQLKLIEPLFSDVSHNTAITAEDGEEVRGTVQLTGCHTGRTTLPALSHLTPTGKRFSLPPEPFVARVREGRIVTIHVAMGEGGGLPGIIKQLTGGPDDGT